ncbi:hypothetical protein GQE99_00160 [Maritimibacter sp. DP07]|jgi:hypothetical protein|uniref:Uncharacterized protein n=2 Tax=Maritimibacter harenae TaxID=2606218 RepID=A0A845M530_9RHOB|nr:hypothetical protein [Maritimibacter harenae]
MAAPAQVTWAEVGANGSEVVMIGGERRTLFGRSKWQLSVADAITMIEQDEWRFFVEEDGDTDWLEIRETPEGDKVLPLSGPISKVL